MLMLVDVFSLLAVSFDRFFAIVFPFRPRMGHLAAYIICGVIWILSAAIAAPLIAARVYKVRRSILSVITVLSSVDQIGSTHRSVNGRMFWNRGALTTLPSLSCTTSPSMPFSSGFL